MYAQVSGAGGNTRVGTLQRDLEVTVSTSVISLSNAYLYTYLLPKLWNQPRNKMCFLKVTATEADTIKQSGWRMENEYVATYDLQNGVLLVALLFSTIFVLCVLS
jgi:hypothetical protein